MSEHSSSSAGDEHAAVILAKVSVVRNLVDGARWSLLDAVVEINELETKLKQLGLTASRPDTATDDSEPGSLLT